MALPKKIQNYPERDLRLGIKSSFPNVRSSLALVYLLWKSSDRVSSLNYSKQVGDEIQIADDCAIRLTQLLSPIITANNVSAESVITTVNDNQLFKAYVERVATSHELISTKINVSINDTSVSGIVLTKAFLQSIPHLSADGHSSSFQ